MSAATSLPVDRASFFFFFFMMPSMHAIQMLFNK